MKNAKMFIYAALVIMGMAIVLACSNPAGGSTTNNNPNLSNNGGTISVTFTTNGSDSTKTFNYYLGGVACAKSSVSSGAGTSTVYSIIGFENGTGNTGGMFQFSYSVAASSLFVISYMPNVAVSGSLMYNSVATGTIPSIPVNVGNPFVWNNTLPLPLDATASAGMINPGTKLKSFSINAPLK